VDFCSLQLEPLLQTQAAESQLKSLKKTLHNALARTVAMAKITSVLVETLAKAKALATPLSTSVVVITLAQAKVGSTRSLKKSALNTKPKLRKAKSCFGEYPGV